LFDSLLSFWNNREALRAFIEHYPYLGIFLFIGLQSLQVVIAPYDVRMSGFAGGGINAVTKRGTNEFHGSAYFKYRDPSFAGKTPGDVDNEDRERLPDFTAMTYGLTLGGPIIKDKLFFFVNAEFQKDETPQPFDFADYTGASTEAELNDLAELLRTEYGYDPGGFLNNTRELNGKKIEFRYSNFEFWCDSPDSGLRAVSSKFCHLKKNSGYSL